MQSPHFRHSRRKGRDENYTVSTIINQSVYNVYLVKCMVVVEVEVHLVKTVPVIPFFLDFEI